MTVELPAELDEWLDHRADALDVERADVVVQLLASYHAAASLDGDLDPREVFGEDASAVLDVEAAVDDVIEDRGEDVVATAVERELADRLADEVEAAVEEHLPRVTDAVEGRLEEQIDEIVAERLAESVGDTIDERVEARVQAQVEERVEHRIEALDAEFHEKIVDVRERVIQVKKEADSKAPADHEHEAFEDVDALETRLEDVEASVDQLEGTVESVSEDLKDEVDGVLADHDAVDDRLSDTEDKLKRVAWVVGDLKDDIGGRSTYDQAVARIKHAAAQEGVTAADCERCGESVDVALLTDPECPHCNATVSDVRPTGGIFRPKATLVAAAQLESGEVQ